MPSFDSPIGGKKFSGSTMKEFDIPDDSEDQQEQPMPTRHRGLPSLDENAIREFQQRVSAPERDPREAAAIEREMRAAKEARRTGKERLNEGARRRIEMLVGMTRTVREVQIDANVFILQTLKSKEMRDAFVAAAEFDGTVQSPFEIRRQLLARSLTQVAGVDIHQFVGSNTLEAKLELIDDLDEPLLNRLFDEYSELVKGAREKYAIKTDKDAQEVFEDLKK